MMRQQIPLLSLAQKAKIAKQAVASETVIIFNLSIVIYLVNEMD
ncbi:hypothetical protein GEW_04712 [Pasteurella multocida subsp. gallicida str. Anand1_poultry]|nr:hypothetical protein GEW_04712 [Pasteurella multocida subsp. gallicida str. Anand1_poultry]